MCTFAGIMGVFRLAIQIITKSFTTSYEYSRPINMCLTTALSCWSWLWRRASRWTVLAPDIYSYSTCAASVWAISPD